MLLRSLQQEKVATAENTVAKQEMLRQTETAREAADIQMRKVSASEERLRLASGDAAGQDSKLEDLRMKYVDRHRGIN